MQLAVDKLKLLHAIRGFAALYVVIAHAKFPFWVGGRTYMEKFPMSQWSWSDYLLFPLDVFTSNGTSMVMVFFVLSGFFINYTFDRNKWKLKEFYLNRFIRIYVPFFASVLFAVVVFFIVASFNSRIFTSTIESEFLSGIGRAYRNFDLETFYKSLLFLRNDSVYIAHNFPYWSLLYEAIFYIIAPFVIRIPLAYLIISALFYISSYFYPPTLIASRFLQHYSLFFAMGIFAYHILNTKKIIKPPVLLAAIAEVILLLATVGLGLKGFYQTSFIFGGLFSIGLIYLFVTSEIKQTLVLQFFKQMGKISYTMYLFHFPLYILLFAVLNYFTDQYIFYSRIYWFFVLLILPVCYLIYVLVEEKSLSLISKLKKQRAANK